MEKVRKKTKITGMDLNIKYLTFEVNGEIHNMHIRYTHRKGIEYEGAIFDGYPAKIIDAYPPLRKVIQISASIIWGNLKFKLQKIAHKMKDRDLSSGHKLHR